MDIIVFRTGIDDGCKMRLSVYFDLLLALLSPRFIVETVLCRQLAKRAQNLSPCDPYLANNGSRDQSLTGIGGPRVYVLFEEGKLQVYFMFIHIYYLFRKIVRILLFL